VASTYDSDDAILSSKLTSASVTVASLAFSRDVNGRIAKETDAAALRATTSYAYDGNSQVVADSGGKFAYDAAGQLTGNESATQTFDDAGELTTLVSAGATTSFHYSASGDRIGMSSAWGGHQATDYDGEHRVHGTEDVVPTPAITAAAPIAIPTVGSTIVTLTGTGFTLRRP
jgi:YD repeat-containing protein